jgi:hypothetical protein
MARSFVLFFVASLLVPCILGFQPISPKSSPPKYVLQMAQQDPQALATGHSQAMELGDAIQEATEMALRALPKPGDDGGAKIDLAIISVSDLYDGNSNPSEVVPALLKAAESYGKGIQHVVGSSMGGFVSSTPNLAPPSEDAVVRACQAVEREGIPAVAVTLCVLPDVQVKVRRTTTFSKVPSRSTGESSILC